MSLLSRLESRFQRWAIPNVTLYLLAGQMLLYFLVQLQPDSVNLHKIMLRPSAVLSGEIWRVVTFLFLPPAQSPIFVIFYVMLMYRFGTGLELAWGTFRYNFFLLIGWMANVGAVFIAYALGYNEPAGNLFLYGTIFLAFARLFPTFIIQLFFILPIEIKWLALLAWLTYAYQFVVGDGISRMLILASVANYFVFFGREHVRAVTRAQRKHRFQAKTKRGARAVRHKCLVCGLDSASSPKTLFRYCSKCAGQCCYCPEHIHDHEHVVDDHSETDAEIDSKTDAVSDVELTEAERD